MKKLFQLNILSIFFLFSALYSCNSDDAENANGGGLEVTGVYLAQTDELVTIGNAGAVYYIKGNGFINIKHVYFNDYESYFNPTLVTPNLIVIQVDENTPYYDVSNEIRIETTSNSVVFPFVIAPPAPILKSFQPVNAQEGENITLYGNYFIDPQVFFGNTEAQVVSSDLTSIVVTVPAGAQHTYARVLTLSGEATWGTALGTAIYDDAFYAPWTIEDWNNHEYVTDADNAFQGNVFIKKEIAGWDNIQGNWGWDDQISQYTGIKFAIRSDNPGKLVFIFNGANWGDANWSFDTISEWQEFEYTWEQLGNPAALQNISFQEFSGNTNNYYFDNITFTVD